MGRAGTGFAGVFALDWQQTVVDGVVGADPEWLRAGSVWRWAGMAVRMDGAPGLLPLAPTPAAGQWRRRAARSVARLPGLPVRDPVRRAAQELPPAPPRDGFTLMAGGRHFEARFVRSGARLLLALGPGLPPMAQDCIVTSVDHVPATGQADVPELPCGIMADTLIDTPDGLRPADALRPGDRVLTRDNGAQPLLWVGRLRYPGTELRRHPALRPLQLVVRVDARAREPVTVAPAQGVELDAAQVLGPGTALALAHDLRNGDGVRALSPAHGVDYSLLLFARPQLICAGGTGLESVRPHALTPALRRWLCTARAGPVHDGPGLNALPPTWRHLSSGEAALLTQAPLHRQGGD